MGNICPWCRKSDDSEANNPYNEDSTQSNSQRRLISTDVDDRTPLLSKSNSHNQYNQSVPSALSSSTTVEPSSLVTNIVPPPPPPPILDDHYIEPTSKFASNNDTDHSSMAIIVERMLPDLIDVGGWGGGIHQVHSNMHNSNAHSDYLKQILCKSLQSTRVTTLPDASASNLSTLLSSRPISSDLCHFVAQTANELSRLLIEEIKIVHKEDLVVTFE